MPRLPTLACQKPSAARLDYTALSTRPALTKPGRTTTQTNGNMRNLLNHLNNQRHLVILFAEGLVSVSIQFLFLRHLMPYVGSSITVSSIVISVFLLALASGYRSGGAFVGNYLRKLYGNLLASAALLALALSPVVTGSYFTLANNWNSSIALTIYSALLLAPPVFWLGQTMPLLSNAVTSQRKSEISGTVLFYSTIGNVIGGLFSVFILIQFAGLGAAITINLTLLALIALATIEQRITPTQIASAAACALLAVFMVFMPYSRYDKANLYGNYFITETSQSSRIMHANFLMMSGIATSKDGKSNYFDYINSFRRHIANMPTGREILVIGAGGFTLGHGNSRHRFTYVDIDGELKAYAEKAFLREPINGEFIASDGRAFLGKNQKQYDALVIDTFSSKNAIPTHMVTLEFFQLAARSVKDNGLVLINTIQEPAFSTDRGNKLHASILGAMPFCYTMASAAGLIPPAESRSSTYTTTSGINVLYLCRKITETSPSRDNGLVFN